MRNVLESIGSWLLLILGFIIVIGLFINYILLGATFVFFFVNMFIEKVDFWQPAIWFGLELISLIVLFVLTLFVQFWTDTF